MIPKFLLPAATAIGSSAALAEIPRVEIVVAQKIVSRTVELVRAPFDGDVHDRARIAPVFRRALRLSVELDERVDGKERRGRAGHATLIERRLVAERVVVVHAVNQKDVRLLALAVDGVRTERATLRTRRRARRKRRQSA